MANHHYPDDPTQHLQTVPAGDPGHMWLVPQHEHTDPPAPVVSVRYHSGEDSDGEPYERVEVDFHRAPPESVLLGVLQILLISSRTTVVTQEEAGGKAHVWAEKIKEATTNMGQTDG